jgi:hypothetical protein
MNTSRNTLGRQAVVVGSLALVGGIGQLAPDRASAATITLDGVANIQATNGLTNSTYFTTNTTPGADVGFGPGKSFPHMISREHSSNSGAYEILPFIRVKTSGVSLGAGEFVSGAELGLGYTDSAYYNAGTTDPNRSNYVDLWSVSNAFTPASVNMTTYDGANNWADGFQAGINGYTRVGPTPQAHLAFLWHDDDAPAGTPSNQINDNVQGYKLFKGGNLDAYLTQQILAGQDSYFALTNNGDNGDGLRWVAPSDVSWGGNFDNRPYLTIRTEVPEPASGLAVLALGGAALTRRHRRRENSL